MKKIVLTVLCLFFAVAGSASAASTSSLGVAGGYNLFTLNSTVTNKLYNSDSEGSVAIAGSATITSYGVASSLSGSAAKLVVGGELTVSDVEVGTSGSGSIYTDGSTIGNVTAATSKSLSESGVDFTSAKNYLISASSQWATDLSVTGSVTDINNGGALTLTGTGSSLEVFNLNILDLENAYSLTVADVNPDATVLVNIAGTGMSNSSSNITFNFGGIEASMILYNFYEAESLSFGSIDGSVLAASAAVIYNNGQINGQMIADSIDAQGEFHKVAFDGDLPAVPLPCSLGLLGGGLLCLAGLRRRNV